MEVVKFKKMYDDAILPTQAHTGDAGLDLYSHDCVIIHPGETVKIDTGVAMALPEYSFGAIYARSGLATKQGLAPANCVGVVDCGYRNNIIVALHNHSNEDRQINVGDRIAQLIVQPYIPCIPIEVNQLDQTERGLNGFGSTGV